MSPDEVDLLQLSGQVFVVNISVLITQSILYGLYLAVFGFGIRALLRKRRRTKSIWILLGLFLIISLLFTAKLATFIGYNTILIRGALVENPDAPLLDRFSLADDETNGIYFAINWLSGWAGAGLLTIFADAVVVWRACVLWPGNTLVKLVLLILLSTSFMIVSSTINILISGTLDNGISVASWITGSLSQSLSLTTNIISTALIGYKAYRHRNEMKSTIVSSNSKASPVLLFLTESGIVFCVLQIFTLITSELPMIPASTFDQVIQVWQPIMNFAAATYPILILLIVDGCHSISQRIESSLIIPDSFRSSGTGTNPHLQSD